MLQQIQRSSDLVLGSTRFNETEQLSSQLDDAGEGVTKALEAIAAFDTELHTFYEELVLIFADLRLQLERLEKAVAEEQAKRRK